jgi:6,7-dimethyl-8-ribityllumazine synthase
MAKVYEGKLTVGKGVRFAIVVSRFNEFITAKLLSGCQDALVRHGADPGAIEVAWVPGGLEIPLAAAKLAARKDVAAVICLAAIIRGGTPHFEYVASGLYRGIEHLARASGKPIISGILTTESLEQAIERAGTKAGNRGADAAQTAIEMVSLLGQL